MLDLLIPGYRGKSPVDMPIQVATAGALDAKQSFHRAIIANG